MKQKDVAMVIVIVVISGLVSFFISRLLFARPQDKLMQAEVVSEITSDFTRPSSKYFNENSINPTQQITIGENPNASPFNER